MSFVSWTKLGARDNEVLTLGDVLCGSDIIECDSTDGKAATRRATVIAHVKAILFDREERE